jgi:hypothetical protein
MSAKQSHDPERLAVNSLGTIYEVTQSNVIGRP